MRRIGSLRWEVVEEAREGARCYGQRAWSRMSAVMVARLASRRCGEEWPTFGGSLTLAGAELAKGSPTMFRQQSSGVLSQRAATFVAHSQARRRTQLHHPQPGATALITIPRTPHATGDEASQHGQHQIGPHPAPSLQRPLPARPPLEA